MLFANALIGLREGLEAALVVVILLAFLKKIGRESARRWVWLGVAVAIVLSVALGALLTFGTRQLTFEQQELVGGSASILAVIFVTIMVFWMRSAGATMSGELKGKMSKALDLGPLAIATVGFLGVGREGLETAIFFYATTQAAGAGTWQPMLGWIIGLGSAVLLGILIYQGAVRINLAKFFRYTGIFLIFVAAGILAYGIHDLQEAAFLPGLNNLAFDVSRVFDPNSWYAALAKGILNFTPATTVLQAIAWTAYVAIVLPLYLRPVQHEGPAATSAAAGSTESASPTSVA